MTTVRKVSVIGLGYVGLTIATAFGKKKPVIGFDLDENRLSELKNGFDHNGEITSQDLKAAEIEYTTDANLLKNADFHIIAVPTPLDSQAQPNLTILLDASKIVAEQIKKGDVVVYESSVFPGVTEERCIPILEQHSHLKAGIDFGVGYSPERINPGDKIHTFCNIVKVISAIDEKTLDIMQSVYQGIIEAGTFKVSSIKIAEATKIIENTQRDINIAFMNEVAQILHHMDMNLAEVLEATRTKWNALPFTPGLVGGHCIGINSHYLAHKAIESGYQPNLIVAAQKVNEDMLHYLADIINQHLAQLNKSNEGLRLGILGVTYKPDYPDFQDSKTIELINLIKAKNLQIFIHDPLVHYESLRKFFKLNLVTWNELFHLDGLVIAVGHQEYKNLKYQEIRRMLKENSFIIDIAGILYNLKEKDFDMKVWKL